MVVGSDLRRTGWFSSSHELLNRFHENVVWSTRGNFVDLPTDCPQRDERLGWTGDVQVFGPTATFLYDTAGLLRSWLADLSAEQLPDGSVPHVVPGRQPQRRSRSRRPPPGVMPRRSCPWTLYQRTGDLEILQRQLPSMRAWVDRVLELAGPDRLWSGGFQYGDWLDPTAPPEDPSWAKADPDVVATAHLARSSWIVAESARLLGRDDEAEKYRILAEEVRSAFVRAFVTPSGRIFSDAQTVYALAIEWDLLPGGPPARGGGAAARRPRPDGRVPDRHRLRRNAAGLRRADQHRPRRRRLPAAAADPVPVLALPGHHGRHHHLGALGQPAARRQRQPRRHDVVQPLRPGRRRRLAPPPRRRARACRPRLPTPQRSPPAHRRAHPGLRDGTSPRTAKRPSPGNAAAVGSDSRCTSRSARRPTVRVPGTPDTVRVGHGDHRWEVADPVTGRRGHRPDWSRSTVRDLLDDPLAWDRLVSAAIRTGVAHDDTQVARMLTSYLDTPAAQVAQALAPDDRFPGAQDLRDQVADLLGEPASVAASTSAHNKPLTLHHSAQATPTAQRQGDA